MQPTWPSRQQVAAPTQKVPWPQHIDGEAFSQQSYGATILCEINAGAHTGRAEGQQGEGFVELHAGTKPGLQES